MPILDFEFTDKAIRVGAPCLKEDPDLHFPDGEGAAFQSQIAQAKAVCARCPIIATCLEYALENNIDEGIWGGKDEEQRREMRRARKGKPTKQELALAEAGTLYAELSVLDDDDALRAELEAITV